MPKKVKLGDLDATARGFQLIEFRDVYGEKCSLQISSKARCDTTDSRFGWLWLGVTDSAPRIMKSDARRLGIPLEPGVEVSGWMDYPLPDEVLISSRMHIGEGEVKGLIEQLQHWLRTGNLKRV